MKLVAVVALAVSLIVLVRRNLLQVDLSFPLFAGVVILGVASLSEGFIHWTAAQLGFIDPPFAIIMIAIALLLAMITILSIALSRIQYRQMMLVRHLAMTELAQRETELRHRSQGHPSESNPQGARPDASNSSR
ncbi:MAG: DUF2304 domain-containing protein [Planctomycetes bacterium]|nr:DUF2304 domain-containing protein [Planctomycetota bacterium]